MLHSLTIGFFLATAALAQDPFVPLNMEAATPALSQASARETWVRITNQRMEMAGKTLRVAQEGDGFTAVVLAKGVDKPRHAKPILTGKGEFELLFKSIVAQGFTRIVVRNPDTGKAWSARLEQGRSILER